MKPIDYFGLIAFCSALAYVMWVAMIVAIEDYQAMRRIEARKKSEPKQEAKP